MNDPAGAPLLVLTTVTEKGLVEHLDRAVHGPPVAAGVLGPDLLDELLDDLPGLDEPVGALWCWARFEELWADLPAPLAEAPDDYRDAAVELAEAALDAARRRDATLLFVLPALPAARPLGVGDAGDPGGTAATAARVREALRDRLAGQRGVALLDADEDARALGAARAADGSGAPTEDLCAALAARTATLLALLDRPRPRLAVVEGDGVLWEGTLAADGAGGVAPRPAVGPRLAQLRRAGTAVAVVADADPDALDTALDTALDRAPGSLRRHQLAARRAGALTADVLAELAAAAGAEPAEVVVVRAREGGPPGWAVHVVPPGGVPLPDRLPPDGRDARARRPGAGPDAAVPAWPAEIPAAVGAVVRFPEPDAAVAARLGDLGRAGAPLDLDGPGVGSAEVAALAADGAHVVRLAALADAEGEHGLVGLGVVALGAGDGPAELTVFRVLAAGAGRGVERALLAELAAAAARHGATAITTGPAGGHAGRFLAAMGLGERPAPLPTAVAPAGVRVEHPR